ncbi:hypothetical protein [Flavobacterium sp.]
MAILYYLYISSGFAGYNIYRYLQTNNYYFLFSFSASGMLLAIGSLI